MPEKLLNIKEAAAYLGVSEEEVKRLVDEDEVPAYKVGGTFLRFRREQLDAVRSEVFEFEKEHVPAPQAAAVTQKRPAHPYTDLEKDIKRAEPVVRQYDYTVMERVKDFFYFNDFYLLSCILIFLLLYMIVVQG
jgi:excisionase family DNA binding protein